MDQSISLLGRPRRLSQNLTTDHRDEVVTRASGAVITSRKSPECTVKTCLTESSFSPAFSNDAEGTPPPIVPATPDSPATSHSSRIHDLRGHPSKLNESTESSFVDLDDETSFLSMESASAAKSTTPRKSATSSRMKRLVRIIGLPSSNERGSPSSRSRYTHDDGESVFDRLYNDARHKMTRARRRASDYGSVASARSSYYSGSVTGSGSPRRLSYMPSMASSKRFRQRRRASLSSNLSSPTVVIREENPVFDRLYRNEPRETPLWKTPATPTRRVNRKETPLSPGTLALMQHESAVVSLQSWWRMQMVHLAFHATRVCIVLVQSAIRKHICRSRLTFVRREIAATQIQSWWRSTVLQSEYETLVYCAIVIQQAYLWYRQATMQEAVESGAVTKLQSFWRGTLYRDHYRTLRYCAIVVQSSYRMYKSASFHSLEKDSICRIQAWWRMILCQSSYRQSKLYADQLLSCHAQTIQRWWRMVYIQAEYQMLRYCAIEIQRAYRGHTARRVPDLSSRSKTAPLSCSPLALVSARGATRLLKPDEGNAEISRQQDPSVPPKRFVRSLHQPTSQESSRGRATVVCIQSIWRAYLAQGHLCTARAAASLIQASGRGMIVRRQFAQMRRLRMQQRESHEPAGFVQTLYREYAARSQQVLRRRSLTETEISALCIQCAWRSYVSRSVLSLNRSSAIMVQSTVRGMLCRSMINRQLKSKLSAEERKSAVNLQGVWRGYQARSRHQQLRAAVEMVQSAFRGSSARANLRALRSQKQLMRANDSAAIIQATFRGYFDCSRFLLLRSAAIFLQSVIRGSTQRSSFAAKRAAAKSIQLHWRNGLVHARRREAAAARQIQTAWFRFIARAKFCEARVAAILIQATFRGYLRVQTYRLRKLQRQSAVQVQRSFRGYLARSKYAFAVEKCVLIQSALRMIRQLRAYENKKHAATSIETAGRSWLKRVAYIQSRSSTVRIQAMWRSHVARRRMINAKLAATKIQAAGRRYSQLHAYSLQRQQVILLQSILRRRLIESTLRTWNAAAHLVQSRWSVYCLRRQERNAKRKMQACFAVRIQRVVRRFLLYRRLEDSGMILSCLAIETVPRLESSQSTSETTIGCISGVSATRIQVAFASWRFKSVLRKLVVSTDLLARCVEGSFSRSTRLVAIRQCIACVDSKALHVFSRVVAHGSLVHVSSATCWSSTVQQVRSCACTLMQRWYRRRRPRILLGRDQKKIFRKARPPSPAVAVKVVESVSNHRLRAELCPAERLRQRIACTRIQLFLRRCIQKSSSKDSFETAFSSPVSVHVVKSVNRHKVCAELRPLKSTADTRYCRKDITTKLFSSEQEAGDHDLQKILRRVEIEANEEVSALLSGSKTTSAPCTQRLLSRVRRAKVERAICEAGALQQGTLHLESEVSPIKPL